MSSPFPGMDPYLEGTLWSDVHQELSSSIRQQLAAKVTPKYITRLNPYTVRDTGYKDDIGIMYPDVGLLPSDRMREFQQPVAEGSPSTIPALEFVELTEVEIDIPVIEIRDRDSRQLVTAIEVISPANKRGEAIWKYAQKVKQLHSSGVHVLEIDLIRRGERHPKTVSIPDKGYRFTLRRAHTRKVQVWMTNIIETLPILPVPLKHPDSDVVLDLGDALRETYRRGMYDLSIDYGENPPPPELSKKEQEWWEKQ